MYFAERGGFEPPIPFRGILAFQASQFNHSCISPKNGAIYKNFLRGNKLSSFRRRTTGHTGHPPVQLISPHSSLARRADSFSAGRLPPSSIIIFVAAASVVISLPLMTPALVSPAEVSYSPIPTLPAWHCV